MDIRKITPDLSVSPQITAGDVAALKTMGFRSIICNRPDREGADQPDFDAIKAAAADAGLEVRYLPIASGMVTDDQAADFGTALRELPAPVLAYCRSGTRSTILWSLSQAGDRSLEDILTAAQNAGYDMGALAPRIANSGTD